VTVKSFAAVAKFSLFAKATRVSKRVSASKAPALTAQGFSGFWLIGSAVGSLFVSEEAHMRLFAFSDSVVFGKSHQ